MSTYVPCWGGAAFGGGGAGQPSGYSSSTSGRSYFGGGSGGLVTHTNVTGNTAGVGGDGLVIIRILEV